MPAKDSLQTASAILEYVEGGYDQWCKEHTIALEIDASYERGRAAMAAEVRELTKSAGTGALLSAERGKALGYSSGHDEKIADGFRAHLIVLRAFLNTAEGAD